MNRAVKAIVVYTCLTLVPAVLPIVVPIVIDKTVDLSKAAYNKTREYAKFGRKVKGVTIEGSIIDLDERHYSIA